MKERNIVIIHNNLNGLVIGQAAREAYIAMGSILGIEEAHVFSFSMEHIQKYKRRPLVVILSGMKDRYNTAETAGVAVIECGEGYSEIMLAIKQAENL